MPAPHLLEAVERLLDCSVADGMQAYAVTASIRLLYHGKQILAPDSGFAASGGIVGVRFCQIACMRLAHAVCDLLYACEAQALGCQRACVPSRVLKPRFHLQEAAHAQGQLTCRLELPQDADGIVFGNAAVRPDATGGRHAEGERFPDDIAQCTVHVGRHVGKAPYRVVSRWLLAYARRVAVLVAADHAALGVGLLGCIARRLECPAVHPPHVHVP